MYPWVLYKYNHICFAIINCVKLVGAEEKSKQQSFNSHLYALSVALAIGYYFRLPNRATRPYGGNREEYCQLVNGKLLSGVAFTFESILTCLFDRFYQETKIPG